MSVMRRVLFRNNERLEKFQRTWDWVKKDTRWGGIVQASCSGDPGVDRGYGEDGVGLLSSLSQVELELPQLHLLHKTFVLQFFESQVVDFCGWVRHE